MHQGVDKMEGVGLGAVAAAKAYADSDPTELATWKAGEPVPFLFLATTFEAIAQVPQRLKMTQLLVTCFRTILTTTPEDLLPAVYLCSNQVGFLSHLWSQSKHSILRNNQQVPTCVRLSIVMTHSLFCVSCFSGLLFYLRVVHAFLLHVAGCSIARRTGAGHWRLHLDEGIPLSRLLKRHEHFGQQELHVRNAIQTNMKLLLASFNNFVQCTAG